MARNMLEELRRKFQTVRDFKSKAKGNFNPERLKAFEGFKELSQEHREKITESLNELARIVLLHLSNINRTQNEKRRSLPAIRLQGKDS